MFYKTLQNFTTDYPLTTNVERGFSVLTLLSTKLTKCYNPKLIEKTNAIDFIGVK